VNADTENKLPDVLVLPQDPSVRLVKQIGTAVGAMLIGGIAILLFMAGQPGWAMLFLLLLATWIIAFAIHLTERLRLDREGFDYRFGPRAWRCKWSECKAFEAREGGRGRGRVVIRFAEARPVFGLLGSGISSDEALLTSFNMEAAKLAAIMNRFQERALADSGAGTTP